jgi:tRNA threonylcarbamoyladenosine biosynthesis protein TsaB
MKLLAGDTSTSVNTVAVLDGDRVLAETVVESGRTHTERLLGTIDWVLGQAGITLDALDVLAVSVGPGSFTGLRVGLATWKGLAAGSGLGLIGVPTLDAMTRVNVFRDAFVCPLLDAKMGEVFGAVYSFTAGTRRKLTEDRACPVDDILAGLDGEIVFLGDGAEKYRERIERRIQRAVFVPGPFSVPRASAVALEAQAMLDADVSTDPAAVVPVYLRRSQAEMARDKAAPR